MKPRFISDLHLSEKHPELTQAFFTFLNESKEACTHLFILGDLFETWIGDDDDTPIYQEIKNALLSFTTNGPKTFFMHGNRDFLVGESFATETGITILPDPYTLEINDQKVVLSHGDFLCTDDEEYINFRNEVREQDWQSNFLSKSVILQIQRIRREIIRLLTGLNILYKNLLACPYTNDPLLEQSLQNSISSLENNLITLDNLFPTAKTDSILPSLYGGYEIDIIKEEVVDAGIKLLRRRVIVADQRGISVYEGKPTFASDDQVLIKEGQYQIDKLGNVGTSDEGNSSPTNQTIIDDMNELGFNPDNVTVTPDDID